MNLNYELEKAAENLASGHYQDAHAVLMGVLKVQPATAEALYLLGVIAAEHSNHAKACDLFDRALHLDPGAARYRAEKARSLVALFRREDALKETEAAALSDRLSARTLDTIGVVFSRLGLHERAIGLYKRATSLEPRNTSYLYNLATGLQFVGDLESSHQTYRHLLKLDPRDVKAWSSMVLMTKQTPAANHVAPLQELFGTLTDADDRLHIGHALAKSHEDMGDAAATMHWLELAKIAKRSSVRYDDAATARLFAAAAATAQFEPGDSHGCEDPSPVFIVGLPRTGTTLIDRILSQHSAVQSAGELSDFALELKRRAKTPSPFVLDPETLLAAQSIDLATAGEAYIARARKVVGDTPRFVDKMPLNFFYAGLILRALPNARIICLRRHPADTVLSNYRQMFATGYSYYRYSYDLRWAASYYAEFDRLIADYRDKLSADRFTEVAYEAVVGDLEGEARRLIAFCGLEWEPQCVDFHENAAPVATASSAQVRRPLYATSVGRWRRYEAHMQPALDVLRSAGIGV